MTDAGVPSRPFPSQAIYSLEAAPTEGSGAPVLPSTLVMPALSELQSYTAVYLQRFGSLVGQSVLVRGAHGAGKTHALGYLMGKVAAGEFGDGRTGTIQLYAKADGPGLAEVYRRLMAQLPPARLRDLTQRFTADLAGRSISPDASDSGLAEELRKRPVLVGEMLGNYAIDESELVAQREREVGRLTDESRDFLNALGWMDSELGEVARRWFSGARLAPELLRSIGVERAIETDEMAKFAVQLLASMCSRSGVPLIVYIDQYEKLLLGPDGELDRGVAGAVHTLAEVVPKEDAMIVLSGNEEVWQKLPSDLKQRFGHRVVECRGLDIREAAALVNLCLRPREEAIVERELEDDDIAPFTFDGLSLLHLYSSGNARRLLELCAAAYDRREPDGPIDRPAACAAAESLGAERVDLPMLLDAVRLAAESHGYTVALTSEGWAGVSLRLSLHGRERVYVGVGQSAHYYDEVIDAQRYVDLAERLRAERPGAHLVLVVLGYQSPEVMQELSRAGIEVMGFEPATFDGRFGETLERVAASTGGSGNQGALVSQIESIRSALDELTREREADLRGILDKAATIEGHQQQERLATRWKKALDDWVEERRSLEAHVRKVRDERRRSELKELEELRRRAESDRDSRMLVGSLAILGLVTVAVLGVSLPAASRSEGLGWGFSLAIGAGACLAGMILFAYIKLLTDGPWSVRDYVLRSRLQRELASPVGSAEDLRRLAHRERLNHAPVGVYVRHPNPQVRYVAAVVADDDELANLAEALPGERCALVRRAFAVRVAADPSLAEATLAQLGDSDFADAGYLLDGALIARGVLDKPMNRWARLVELMTYMSRLPERLPATRVLAVEVTGRDDLKRLDAAIADGLPFSSREEIVWLSSEILRRAVRMSSPLDPTGLGTLGELSFGEDVDRAFIVLSQLLFLCELGLFVDY